MTVYKDDLFVLFYQEFVKGLIFSALPRIGVRNQFDFYKKRKKENQPKMDFSIFAKANATKSASLKNRLGLRRRV